MLKILIIPALAIFLVSCGSSNTTPISFLQYHITVGEGGGAAGIMEGIMIDSSGIVSSFKGRTTETSEKTEKGRLSDEQINKVNDLISSLERIEHRESGNLYKFIIMRNPNKPEKRLSWTYPSSQASTADSLEQFYGKITVLINQLNNN